MMIYIRIDGGKISVPAAQRVRDYACQDTIANERSACVTWTGTHWGIPFTHIAGTEHIVFHFCYDRTAILLRI